MDETNYNNGIPPQTGLVWGGESWGWPTSLDKHSTSNTMIVFPSIGPSSLPKGLLHNPNPFSPGDTHFDDGISSLPETASLAAIGSPQILKTHHYDKKQWWGMTLTQNKTPLRESIKAAIARINPIAAAGVSAAAQAVGIVLNTLEASTINSSDPVTREYLVNALPAEFVTGIPTNTLRNQTSVKAEVKIHDFVKDNKQYVAVMKPVNGERYIPVIAYTNNDVYLYNPANIVTPIIFPGMPELFISMNMQMHTEHALNNTTLNDRVPLEVLYPFRGDTAEAILVFPQAYDPVLGFGPMQVPPVYVSITKILNNGELQDYTHQNKVLDDTRHRLEAEAKAAAEAEVRAKLAALMLVAGVPPTPTYTLEMVKSAQTALAAAGRMILNRAPGMIQLSTVAKGVLTTTSEGAGSIAGALWRGVIELSRIATVSTVGSTVGALVIGFWPKEVGLGSDQILGRDMELFAAQAQLFAAGKVNITPEMTSVNLPVRGLLVTENGRQYVSLVKTGIAGVSANVPVLRAVRDEQTGLDKITLPAVAGAPSRTILINPVPVGPTAPANTGNSSPTPVTPVHTGTTIKQADSIVTTTFPAEDLKGLRDFIYWQPDATGSGVEAIYVMFSNPYGDSNSKGKYSGRDYHTDKAGGPIQNLDWKTAKVDRAGVDKVKLHTGRFEETADNKVMIARLEKILKGDLIATDIDKRFYTHEIRELERYRALGIPDGVTDDSVWNNAHTATLEDYKINEKSQPLYTPEAEEAYRKAEEGK